MKFGACQKKQKLFETSQGRHKITAPSPHATKARAVKKRVFHDSNLHALGTQTPNFTVAGRHGGKLTGGGGGAVKRAILQIKNQLSEHVCQANSRAARSHAASSSGHQQDRNGATCSGRGCAAMYL